MNKTVLISLPIEDLQTVIIDCVNSCLRNNKQESKAPTEPVGSKKLYSIKELANFLQVSTVTAQRYKNDGLPCMQYGRKVCFDTEQVLNWLQNPKKRGTK